MGTVSLNSVALYALASYPEDVLVRVAPGQGFLPARRISRPMPPSKYSITFDRY